MNYKFTFYIKCFENTKYFSNIKCFTNIKYSTKIKYKSYIIKDPYKEMILYKGRTLLWNATSAHPEEVMFTDDASGVDEGVTQIFVC